MRRPAGGDFGSVDTVALGTQGVASTRDRVDLQVSPRLDDQGNATRCGARPRTPGEIFDYAWSRLLDAAPPHLDAVSVPGTGTPGGAIGMAATASDRLSSPAITWNFGDGASGAGPAVSHAYGAAGRVLRHGDGDRRRGQLRQHVALGRDRGAARRPAADAEDRLPRAGTLGRRRETDLPAAHEGHRCPREPRPSCAARAASARSSASRPSGCARARSPCSRASRRATSSASGSAASARGQRLQLRITAPGFIGKVVKYRLRKGRIPIGSRPLCLPIGATKPARC